MTIYYNNMPFVIIRTHVLKLKRSEMSVPANSLYAKYVDAQFNFVGREIQVLY